MLDFACSLLEVPTSKKAYLLREPAKVGVVLLQLRDALLLVSDAAVSPGKVNKFADCRGEIAAKLIQWPIPANSELMPFLSPLT